MANVESSTNVTDEVKLLKVEPKPVATVPSPAEALLRTDADFTLVSVVVLLTLGLVFWVS
jgi:hypothetical protein